MDNTQIVKEFIIENFLFGESNHFDENTDLFEKGIIDSTGIIELVGYIEQTFNITVDDEELVANNFSSLSHITRYLRLKTAIKDS